MESKLRIGTGYDVHPLVKHRQLVLGGVEIPFRKGLDGWSDADALTHAIIDALLGAAALGDIGTHFPSGEVQYKDISSLTLLAFNLQLFSFFSCRLGQFFCHRRIQFQFFLQRLRSDIIKIKY